MRREAADEAAFFYEIYGVIIFIDYFRFKGTS